MKIKFRGNDVEYLNDMLKDKNYDLLIGTDANGNDIYENDLLENEDGNLFRATLKFEAVEIEPEENLQNYCLVEN